ncbi:MAG TPA: DUF1254 domain-containing protein [Hyphomicrobiaceae bacterium]|nr:DUF1254 domain-containing protein [Hyphomicrobiaceae bacterium]
MITRRTVVAGLGSLPFLGAHHAGAVESITPARARALAKEAYVYGFPLVDGYRVLHAYYVDKTNREYKGAWNLIHSTARVYTPADVAVQTPNSDTPYSMAGLDLRAEPIVLTVPAIEKNRYFSIQLVDAYTFNFAYIGSRATGNGGGTFMIAGPDWKGRTPAGITKVLRSETRLALALYRTQLFGPDDLENVKKIQAGYKAQPLSEFLGQTAAKAAPAIDFMKPLTPETQKTSLDFFNVLNFVLQFCPTVVSEKGLMSRFQRIGVGAGKTIDPSKLSPEIRDALEKGMADAWAEYNKFKKEKVDTDKVKSGDMFGTRAYLKNNYLHRMAGAVIGIYGNSKEEATYPFFSSGSDGKPLDGSKRYTVRFAPGQLPPAKAFWSLTMYKMPESLLVENPINRYLLNSPMLPQFKKDADGGYTFYVQNESPGKDKEANWLPAPKGPFLVVCRIYWPSEAALAGKWKQPPMTVVG